MRGERPAERSAAPTASQLQAQAALAKRQQENAGKRAALFATVRLGDSCAGAAAPPAAPAPIRSGPEVPGRLERLGHIVGAVDPAAAVAEAKRLAAVQAQEEAQESAAAERELAAAVEQLGGFTRDSVKRKSVFEREYDALATPDKPAERKAQSKLKRHAWAVCKLVGGSQQDLAYAVSCMAADYGPADLAALGALLASATGLRRDGSVTRQLWTPRARRLLQRGYASRMMAMNDKLSNVAGSRSDRPVHALRRVPQRFFGALTRVGNRPWSRSTLTRDATELHNLGLWRRVRLPVEHAPADEIGPSGQVVSRYWSPRAFEVARFRSKKLHALGDVAGALIRAPQAMARRSAWAWARDVGRRAVLFAVKAQREARGPYLPPVVPGLLEPLAAPA